MHTLGPLIVRITDPFGLAEYRSTLAGHSQLVVTPVVASLTGMPAGGELGTGQASAGRAGAGPVRMPSWCAVTGKATTCARCTGARRLGETS